MSPLYTIQHSRLCYFFSDQHLITSHVLTITPSLQSVPRGTSIIQSVTTQEMMSLLSLDAKHSSKKDSYSACSLPVAVKKCLKSSLKEKGFILTQNKVKVYSIVSPWKPKSEEPETAGYIVSSQETESNECLLVLSSFRGDSSAHSQHWSSHRKSSHSPSQAFPETYFPGSTSCQADTNRYKL